MTTKETIKYEQRIQMKIIEVPNFKIYGDKKWQDPIHRKVGRLIYK